MKLDTFSSKLYAASGSLLLIGVMYAYGSAAQAHQSGRINVSRGAETVASTGDWFYWDFHPSIVIGITVLTVLYTLGLTVFRKKYALVEVKDISRGRTVAFYVSMALLWLTLDGPLHHLSDELLFSGHMVQHLMLQLAWAPLFLIGQQGWMLRPIARRPLIQKIGRVITKPRTAFVLINAMLIFWHVPYFYNLALSYHPLHIVQHLIFLSTAVLFWWPVLGCLDDLIPRPDHGTQLIYLVVSTLPMKALGLTIATHEAVLYTHYVNAPRVWGLTPLGDQRSGGILMWVPAGIMLWTALVYVFYRWVKFGTPKRGESGVAAIDERRRRKRAAQAAQAAAAVPPLTTIQPKEST